MEILLKERGILAGDKTLNVKLNALIDTLDSNIVNILVFDTGVYPMTLDEAAKKVVYMTNTVSESEMATPNREIGFYLEKRKNLIIDGNGSTLVYHGRMTEFMLRNCENITLKNFNVDFDKATVIEFKTLRVSGSSIQMEIIPDSEYDITNGKLAFRALNTVDGGVVVQECDVANKTTKRVNIMSWGGNPLDRQSGAVQNSDGTVTMTLIGHLFKEGYVYQMCRAKRDACGTFIDNCKGITLYNNQYYFMHGMGILAQMSENITIDQCKITPNRDKGRTTATFADMIHCSLCKGDIVVRDCEFDGARDDILNVHGNHWIVTELKDNKLTMEFKHPQTYGFKGINVGEEVEFIDRRMLTSVEKRMVKAVEMPSPRTIKLTLDREVEKAQVGMAVENTSRCANLLVEGCVAYNIPTRGILVTTKGKVVIRNNTFNKLHMSAILVADDAMNWYESGYVRDVTIDNNRFIECQDWTVLVHPEVYTVWKHPAVHKNITITNNYIEQSHRKVLNIKRTDGVLIKNNTVKCNGKPIVKFISCKNIVSHI